MGYKVMGCLIGCLIISGIVEPAQESKFLRSCLMCASNGNELAEKRGKSVTWPESVGDNEGNTEAWLALRSLRSETENRAKAAAHRHLGPLLDQLFGDLSEDIEEARTWYGVRDSACTRGEQDLEERGNMLGEDDVPLVFMSESGEQLFMDSSAVVVVRERSERKRGRRKNINRLRCPRILWSVVAWVKNTLF